MIAALAAVVTAGTLLAGCSEAGPTARPGSTGSTASAPSAEVAASAAPAVMARSRPVRVRIPAIDVNSRLIGLGLKKDGTMQVPATGFPAGWFKGGPTPGEIGPAVIVGHVDWAGAAGVFYDLSSLKKGDQVSVSRADGTIARFRITLVETFAKDAFPTEQVYGDLDQAGLRLITCGGSFDEVARSYRDNIIAFADLVTPVPA